MSDAERSKPDTNIARAGEFFVLCLWIQGQMVDLIIFKLNPDLIQPFVSNPERIPSEVAKLRAQYWEKDFGPVKKKFEHLFGNQLSNESREDIDAIFFLRNAIGHAHVSLGRDFFLYRPDKGEEHFAKIVSALELRSVEDASTPPMMKISFYDDQRYINDFNRIQRLDQECFSVLASSLGMPHGRIR